jgi:hypothetical protein
MNTILPSKVLIVLLASCLFWAGGISLAVMWFAGTPMTIGWIMAGALVLALLVWLAVMSHEIRHAMELRAAADLSGKRAERR